MKFIYSLQSEWHKTKGSAASWLCVIGGIFIPLIHLLGYLKNANTINSTHQGIWEPLFRRLWMDMSYFFLPAGVILASSLITQMEYRNNAWKQLHTTPQRFTTIYWAKFSAIILMTVKFFVYFNVGIVLTGLIPCLLFDHAFPKENIPLQLFLKGNANFFTALLPIIAIQYVLSVQFRNFLVPIGFGLASVIGTMMALRWQYIQLSPYSYSMLYAQNFAMTSISYILSLSYFALLMVSGFILYINKSVKG
jgi:lantibiotic transport system permease protein